MISHANAIGVAESFARESRLKPEDTSLAYLPMAWAGDSVYTLFASLTVGFCANCPESPETVQRDLRELGPTTLLAPPRIWENMLTSVQVRAADASPLKRRTFEYFRSAAERAEILRADGKPVPAGLRLATGLGEFFVYGPVRDQLGLRTGQVGAHRRGAARARHLPVLPLDRREPETGLWLHRDHRAGVDAARHRGQSHQRRAPGARRRGQDRRARRGARARLRRVPGLSEERGGHARGHRSGRVVSHRATPASSTPAGTWSSSTAPRTSAPSPTARRSHPSSSRTSSSSARTSARRWPSATTGPS